MLWVVADGIGSLPQSPAAARALVEALQEQLRVGFGYPPDRLEQACRRADRQLRSAFGEAGGAAAALIYAVESGVWVAHCGDVRVYWLRGKEVLFRTDDDVEPDRSHVLRRFFGGRAAGAADLLLRATGPWRPQQGDRLLLVTDGVHGLVGDQELAAFLTGAAPAQEVEALLDLVAARGGRDDATLVALTWTATHSEEDLAATPVAAPWVGRTPLHHLDRDLSLGDGTTEEGLRTQEISPDPVPAPEAPSLAAIRPANPVRLMIASAILVTLAFTAGWLLASC